MSFDFVFNILDAFLIGRKFIDEQHEKASKERDNNHRKPGAHIFEGEKNNVKYFPDNRINNPHFSCF